GRLGLALCLLHFFRRLLTVLLLGIGSLVALAGIWFVLLLIARIRLVGILAKLISHVEGGDDGADQARKSGLVVDGIGKAIEVMGGLFLDPGAPSIDQKLGMLGRGFAGQAMTDKEGDGVLERCILAIGRAADRLLLITIIEHGGEVFRHARHSARS